MISAPPAPSGLVETNFTTSSPNVSFGASLADAWAWLRVMLVAMLLLLRQAPGSLSEKTLARAVRRVQLQGGARGPHARRTSCTLSVRPRAPTKQMGPYHCSSGTGSAGRTGRRSDR